MLLDRSRDGLVLPEALDMSTWSDCFRLITVMVAGTACVTLFMMLTAKNPSADDFWRGVGSFVLGTGASQFYQMVRRRHEPA